MIHRITSALCLLLALGCGSDGSPQAPVGTFALDREASEGFTETLYEMEDKLAVEEARALAARLAAVLSGRVQLSLQGEGALEVEGPNGPLVNVTGQWTQHGRRIVLTSQGPPARTLEFDWIDGSRALHLELPVDDEKVVLVFQEELSPGK